MLRSINVPFPALLEEERADFPNAVAFGPITRVHYRSDVAGSTTVFARRKAFGLFYTPEWLADMLVRWACPSAPADILDPSFGGCAFLLSAYRQLSSLGVDNAGAYLFGIDIDPRARNFARSLLDLGVPPANLAIDDFLTTAFASDRHFQAVVGNPPYIRHHALDDGVVERAQERIRRDGILLPRTASAWAYFTILAAQRVKAGGRLALILPGTVLHSHYATNVIEALANSFLATRILHVRDRLFEATHEESVIILGVAKGKPGSVQYRRVRGRPDLEQALHDQSKDVSHSPDLSYKLSLLPSSVVDAWQDTIHLKPFLPLGSTCRVRIGVVTGANRFFIRSGRDAIFESPFVTRFPIVTARSWLTGPVFDAKGLHFLDEADVPCWLAIISARGRPASTLAKELHRAERHGIAARHKCALRDPWFCLSEREIPHLFLPYMGSTAPALTVNDSKATCTNAIHRVWIEPPETADPGSVAASSYSSLFGFEAELFGRHYGGGVLKLEPTAAKRLHIIPTSAAGALSALRVQGLSPAQRNQIADEEILARLLRCSPPAIRELRSGHNILQRERTRVRAVAKDNGTSPPLEEKFLV